jgi:hypothetical protein
MQRRGFGRFGKSGECRTKPYEGHTAFQRKEILKPAPVIPILFGIFEVFCE